MLFQLAGCCDKPRVFVCFLVACVLVICVSMFHHNPVHVQQMFEDEALSRQRGILSRLSSTQVTDDVLHSNVGERDNSKVRTQQSTTENNTAFWARVASLSNSRYLYPVEFRAQDALSRLATTRVKSAQCFCGEERGINFGGSNVGGPVDFGSTHKWLLHLDGGQLVIFKPMW